MAKFSGREIIFHGPYFTTFLAEQPLKVRERIYYVLNLVRQVERIPETYFKHLEGTDGLFEIRVDVGSNTYRIFCCFDEGRLVVLLNAFQKKSQKTPRGELERAERLKADYFDEKRNGKDNQNRKN
jgi:phage-related protein